MPNEGHRPVTNFETPGRVEERGVVSEGAVVRTSRQTLPYYRRRFGRREMGPERVRLEGAGPAAGLDMDGGPPVDVAVASLGNHMFLEAVIGNDDRVRVSDARMASNPWRQICALRIRSRSEKTYVGTAWFIGPRTLATAGHCVYLQDDGGWAASITVTPAKYGAVAPFGTVTAVRFASVDGWVEQRHGDFDYGVILLDDSGAGSKVGNFAVAALGSSALKAADVQISGYPADRDRAEFQYFHLRPLGDLTETRLIYDVDTFGGQSGSPIWQETSEDGVVAVGIHTTGGLTGNSGTRINDDVLDNLIRWTAG